MALELGNSPIDFELKGTDGDTHSLQDYSEKKAVAVVFSCNHCPYVVASEREFVEIQDKYGDKGFQMIAINSNSANPDYPADSMENMKKRAVEKNFNFPYLSDDDQSVAKQYGAGRTPEIYLFNQDRELVYHGRINDNPTKHDEISRYDFQIAIEETLAGEDVSVPKVPAIGCSIKFVN